MIIYILAILNIISLVIALYFFLKEKKIKEDSKLVAQEFELLQNKLKNTDIDKKEFVEIITHELNTPLAASAGYLSMVLELPETEIKPEILSLIRKSYESTKRMTKTVEDLLGSVKTIGEEKSQAFQLEDIITKVLEDFAEISKAKVLNLHFKLPKKIPLPLVAADPLSVKIILTNLIDNALKFTKKGEIWIEAEEKEKEMVIKVADTGIGINKENLARIFEKFFQVDSSRTREVGGTGVGLHIVKNLVERQGGKIYVESKENNGSSFYFTIPLA